MKPNHNNDINIKTLRNSEATIIKMLRREDIWDSLDVNYFPPRVERLYTTHLGFRIYLHVIHKTDKDCLYHKHRWPTVFKQISGSYEMGITYSQEEIKSEDAHALPDIAKFIINEGSYYEMTQTDCLHYVKPISDTSLSIMMTKDLYPEAEFRKETVDRKLNKLSKDRKLQILNQFIHKMTC